MSVAVTAPRFRPERVLVAEGECQTNVLLEHDEEPACAEDSRAAGRAAAFVADFDDDTWDWFQVSSSAAALLERVVPGERYRLVLERVPAEGEEIP